MLRSLPLSEARQQLLSYAEADEGDAAPPTEEYKYPPELKGFAAAASKRPEGGVRRVMVARPLPGELEGSSGGRRAGPGVGKESLPFAGGAADGHEIRSRLSYCALML